METETRRFLLHGAVFAATLVALDAAVGAVGDFATAKLPDSAVFSGPFVKDNFRLNRTTADVVVVGSSRVAHHFVTARLKDSLDRYAGKDLSVYNAGIDGRLVNSSACAVESILERHSPKLLLLEADESVLSDDGVRRDIELSAPHYRTNRVVKRYLDELGWRARLKMRSNLYRWNQKVFVLATTIPGFAKEDPLNGYVPLDAKMTAADAEREIASLQAPSPPDARIVGNFSRMLAAANAKGVPIVVVSSPGFHSRQEQGTLDSLCRDAGVPYIDMFGMELFDEHPEWFADVYHLNDDGAHVFTALFFERLRPILDSIPSFAR